MKRRNKTAFTSNMIVYKVLWDTERNEMK
jgi:hypothetical protein